MLSVLKIFELINFSIENNHNEKIENNGIKTALDEDYLTWTGVIFSNLNSFSITDKISLFNGGSNECHEADAIAK